MKFDHVVKSNGQYYPAGMEVPDKIDEKTGAVKPPFSDEDIIMETEPVKRGRPKKNG